jgi:hypothetical protein
MISDTSWSSYRLWQTSWYLSSHPTDAAVFAGTDQSVWWAGYRLVKRGTTVWLPPGERFFSEYRVFISTVGSIQYSTSLLGWKVRGVWLWSHNILPVRSLRMHGGISPLLHTSSSHGACLMTGKSLPLFSSTDEVSGNTVHSCFVGERASE